MSDEIAVLRDGRIVQRGSPEDLYERPATHFVADFLGESNFLEGRTIGAGDGLVAYAIGDAVLTQVAAPTEIGTPVLLALRPPKIELRSEEPTSGNRLPGVVRSWTYHGAELQCFIETPAGLLSVVHPTWRSNFAPATGHRLWLTWRPDAAVIVKDDRLGPIR